MLNTRNLKPWPRPGMQCLGYIVRANIYRSVCSICQFSRARAGLKLETRCWPPAHRAYGSERCWIQSKKRHFLVSGIPLPSPEGEADDGQPVHSIFQNRQSHIGNRKSKITNPKSAIENLKWAIENPPHILHLISKTPLLHRRCIFSRG